MVQRDRVQASVNPATREQGRQAGGKTQALGILDDAPPRPSTPPAPALREGDDGT